MRSVVKFIDQWGVRHTLSLEAAAQELKEWKDAWPGGLGEVESAIRTAKTLNKEHDVRNILVRVTPGWDGMGYEEYAKDNNEVVEALTALDEKVDDLQHQLSLVSSPDAYNRKLRAQLEQGWSDVQRLKRAYERTKNNLNLTIKVGDKILPQQWFTRKEVLTLLEQVGVK